MPTWTQEADLKAQFDSTVESGGGTLTDGGALGMQVNITAGTAGDLAYGILSGTTNQTAKTAECQIDPNGLTMGDGDQFDVVLMVGTGAFANHVRITISFTTANGYAIQGQVVNDSVVAVEIIDPPLVITDAPHKVRLVWKAATGAGANDGYVYIYVDDVLAGVVTGIDNDTMDTDSTRFGAARSIDAGTGGTFEMVDCRVFDGIEYLSNHAGVLTFIGTLKSAFVNLFTRLRARSRDRVLSVEARDKTLTVRARDRILTVPPREDE